MAAHARATRQCFISVGAAGGKRLAHKVDIDDLSATTHDPLLAQLRYRLRREHGAPKEGKRIGIACVFSREAVAPPDASCAIEGDGRSEEHTSELQSQSNLVCRLLLEKKKQNRIVTQLTDWR